MSNMADGKGPTQREGRPHYNPSAMQHRELLTPGPVAAELRIRPSPYQHLACGSVKRKVYPSTTDSSRDSSQEGMQLSTKSEDPKPTKALKVIHHNLSSGGPVHERVRGCLKAVTFDGIPIHSEGLEPSEENEGLRVTAAHLTYQQTPSGRGRTTKRQARKCDHGSDGGMQQGDRMLNPRRKANHCPNTQVPASTSGDQTPATAETENTHSSGIGALSAHICTGLACEYPDCHLRPEFSKTTSDLFSHDSCLTSIGANPFRGSLSYPDDCPATFELANDQLESTDDHAASDPTKYLIESLQHPLICMREMAASPYLEVPCQGQAPVTEDDEGVNVSGKAVTV